MRKSGFRPAAIATTNMPLSWAYYLLPYMEESTLYSAYNSSVRDDDTANTQTMRTPLPMFACPSRRSPAADRNFDNNDAPPAAAAQHCAALGDYAANAGYLYTTGMTNSTDTTGVVYIQFGTYNPAEAGPIFSASRIAVRNVTDGLSKTLAIGERYIPPVPTGTERAWKTMPKAIRRLSPAISPARFLPGPRTD